MNRKEFKKLLTTIFNNYGFKYINKGYYNSSNELIVVIATQKSNFEDIYYINYGFLIKEKTPNIEYPKDNICDVRGRFTFENTSPNIDISTIEMDTFEKSMVMFIESKIMPALEFGLKKYFDNFPEAICTANLKAKEYLNLE